MLEKKLCKNLPKLCVGLEIKFTAPLAEANFEALGNSCAYEKGESELPGASSLFKLYIAIVSPY